MIRRLIKFRYWTIRTKLTVILMATSTVAVFLAGIAGIAFSVYESRHWHEQHIDSIIGIISYNCQAALAFGIPEDAEKILSSLDIDESIIMACIYNTKGDPLATYRQTGYPEKLPSPLPKSPRHEYNKGHLEIYKPIYLEGEEIGLIYILDNRLDEKKKVNRDIIVLVLVMFLALLVAYIMSWHLQRLVSAPILSLAQTAANIADKKDYSIRAVKQSDDEVGALIDSFNDMLTQIQQAEEILSQSEERYRTLVDNIGLGITLIDKDHNIVMVNSAIGKLFNVDSSVFVGKKCYEEFARLGLVCAVCPGTKSFETHHIENIEAERIRSDGSKFQVRINAFPMFDDTGNPTGFIEVIEDITERKRADLALRLSEQRFQAIADYTYNWELWISPAGNILWTNPAAERVTGYTIEECMKMKNYPGSLVVPEDRKIAIDAQKKGLKGGRGSLECRITRKDGQIIWVISSWQPIYDKKGVWQGQRVSVRDVTDRKNAEEKLEESRERFRNLVETTSDWIWEIDSNNIYTYVSPKIRDLLGYEPEEILGKTPFDLMPEDEAQKVLQQFQNITASHEPIKGMENVNHHKDGRLITLETNGVAVFDAYGNFSGYRGIDRDVTQRKVAEEERERLMWILEAKNRELESIVYTSSHDLRSTIVNVQGFSSELSMTCDQLLTILNTIPVPQDTKDTLLTIVQDDIPTEIKYITASASKMDMLINGLLKLSRLGRVDTRPEVIDMNSLMSTIIDSMKFQIRESATKLSVGNLPPCKADVSQITQIFWNLIDNAIKYLDPNRPGKIKITGRVKENMSVYCVADNGKGISPRHQKNIFEVFHRLEPEGIIPGEGLGLSIIKRIVDRHSGDVRVESTPGKGSKFFIEMPGV